MSTHDVSLGGGGIPNTVLPAEPADLLDALAGATDSGGDARAAIVEVVSRNPRSLFAWAVLGDIGRDEIEAYAAYRVGYHRGLDALRKNGWRGSGYVRWEHETNRGFLRCLDGLREFAARIGETDEADRCELFLKQLDPGWPPEES